MKNGVKNKENNVRSIPVYVVCGGVKDGDRFTQKVFFAKKKHYNAWSKQFNKMEGTWHYVTSHRHWDQS